MNAFVNVSAGYGHKEVPQWLPLSAQQKLLGLFRELQDARTFTLSAYESMKVARTNVLSLESALREMDARCGMLADKGVTDKVEVERTQLQAAIVVSSEFAADYELRQRGEAEIAALVQRTRDFLAVKRTFVERQPSIDLPASDAGFLPAIMDCRAKINELRGVIQAAEDAPIFSGDAKVIVRREVERLAEIGRPNVFPTLEGRQVPEFPALLVDPTVTRGRVLDGAALVAWVLKDALISALEREIDAVCDDASALSDAERFRRISRARENLLDLERVEEGLIESARAHGVIVARRRDADPRAVLGIAEAEPQSAD